MPLTRPQRRPKAIYPPLPYERKEFWRLEKPDLQPLLRSLRQVPADPMARMALALGQGGALWSRWRVKSG
ncbi:MULTISPECIES: hypothetical protein [unclassified Variovorax]|uniref:hypothetical protein n=1 Tax=unclassified Variovorax TaxID=663243 RepID=UPI001BD53EDF|nr:MULTISPECIES: hypothetical protein [unclassified Variovorax]